MTASRDNLLHEEARRARFPHLARRSLLRNMANMVSMLRTALAVTAFEEISKLPSSQPMAFCWSAVIAVAISLDGLDGWVARRMAVTSPFGSFVDILGDRITEYSGWLMLEAINPAWRALTILIVARHVLVDGVKAASARLGSDMSAGIVAVGWRAKLVHSKVSKILYNSVKASVLSCGILTSVIAPSLVFLTTILFVVHVTLCWVRGIGSILEFRNTLARGRVGLKDRLLGCFELQAGMAVVVLAMCCLGANVYGAMVR